MFDLLRVSFRNVGRNKRRTVITIATVFIGVVVVIGTRGLLNGLQSEIRSGLTRKVHGDLQIHQKGYQDSLESNPYKILIPYTPDVVAKIKGTPGVEAVTPRLRVMALLNHQKSQTSTPVVVSAIDSISELDVCPRINQAVQAGTMIDSSKEQATTVVLDENLEEAVGLDAPQPDTTADVAASAGQAGQASQASQASQAGRAGAAVAPKATGYHQILVTPSLMRGLGASLGDEIVLLVQDKNNMQQAVVANITGVVDYGLPNASARMAWLDFTTLQKVLALENQVSEIAIRTREGADENVIRKQLASSLPESQTVETWLELGGFFRDVMALQNAIFSAVLAVVFVIVISAIVNTSLMTVMERTREIGTLMALGYRRIHILLLFLGESSVIGFGGGLVGLVAAVAMLKVLSINGIDMTIPGAAIPTVLFPWVSTSFQGLVLILATSSALIAGFIPAYRASHMKPIEALATA